MNHLIIPDFQPVPFPAPLWLLKTLLVVGFITHIIPMNIALGGSFWAGVSLLKGKGDPSSFYTRMGQSLGKSLPFFVSFAITQGIVPLLFLQLVYGPLYYTSSILMGTPWILLLVVLLIAYYGLYAYKYRSIQLGRWAPWLLIGVSLLLGFIGFLFSNNMTLMLHPETWSHVVFKPGTGGFWNISEPTLLPRYLHFVLAALAVTGLCVGCFGLYWSFREKEYGEWLIRQGSGLFLGLTLLQIPVGGWFLLALPNGQPHAFMGQDTLGTISFVGSMLLGLIAILSMMLAWRQGKTGPFKIGLVSATDVLALMSIMRHVLREITVNGFFHPEVIPVKTQWDLLIVFIISAVGLIAYLIWLVKTVWNAYNSGLNNSATSLSESFNSINEVNA